MTRQVKAQSSTEPVALQGQAEPETAIHLAGSPCQGATGAPDDGVHSAQDLTRQSSSNSSATRNSAIGKTGKNAARAAERLCVVSRQSLSSHEMLRFVIAPDGMLVPDLKANLPGRGAWVTNSRAMLETAIAKKLFPRSLKQNPEIDPALCDQVEALLRRAALGKLSLARKAGLVITGFNKVCEALRKKDVLVVLHSSEAAQDGRKQIAAAITQREKLKHQDDCPPSSVAVYDGFGGIELDQAFGNSNITHGAVLTAPLAFSLLEDLARLQQFQGLESDIVSFLSRYKSETDLPPRQVHDQARGGG